MEGSTLSNALCISINAQNVVACLAKEFISEIKEAKLSAALFPFRKPNCCSEGVVMGAYLSKNEGIQSSFFDGLCIGTLLNLLI
ncbi:unnamed protein product [Parnassius mnemosyne]|uniref:Uncharacterized protein n=1 Tax=Parnassius mnemosyne TaxID=213953 RepID=A0AAV1M5D9_9NEOP